MGWTVTLAGPSSARVHIVPRTPLGSFMTETKVLAPGRGPQGCGPHPGKRMAADGLDVVNDSLQESRVYPFATSLSRDIHRPSIGQL